MNPVPEQARTALRALARTMVPLVQQKKLWEPGAKLSLALSGGKDSALLLYLLTHGPAFGLPAARLRVLHVSIPPHCACARQAQGIRALVQELPPESFAHLSPTDGDAAAAAGSARAPVNCEDCARMRRRLLLEDCLKNDSQILVLAHHRDDLIQTLLMNILFHGELSGVMQPVRTYADGQIRLIRPLLTTPEKRIIALARKLALLTPPAGPATPVQGQRAYIRQFLAGLGPRKDLVKNNLARLAMNLWPRSPSENGTTTTD